MKSSITDGQKKQYMRFVEDAAERALQEANLDKDRIQKLISQGGKFQTSIIAAIRELSISNQYADEEVRSNYSYPDEYKGPKPIKEQVKALAEILSLDPTSALEYVKNLPELPEGAEGWFAIPAITALAKKHFPEVTDSAKQYCRAVQLIHQKIADSRSFYNYRDGQITTERLRVHARTAHALNQITEMQPGDILIVAAQFGLRHRGRSVRRAREVFVANEFGLGSLAVGSMLLTHPEREVQLEQLHMDCAGDEFAPVADGQFCNAPLFTFGGGKVKFGTCFVVHARGDYGSASAFVPQC